MLAGIAFLLSFEQAAKPPQKVAVAFTRHLLALNFDKAAALGTSATRDFVALMQQALAASGGSMERLKSALPKEIDPKKLKANCTVEGNTAECTLCCNQQGDAATGPMRLVKEGKQWLVDISKETEPK